MKKITMLSIVAAAVLFTGCGEKAKDSATDAAAKAVESTKEAASHAVDATKAAADKAVEAAKETTAKAVESAKETTAKAVEATKEAVDSAKESVAAVSDKAKNVAGAAAYAKCAGCHGADGKTKALGKSPVISGQTKEELVTKINGYKAGTLNVAGMGNLMKGQVATMDDAAIEAVATYISTMK
jgi:cytochrome c553